MQRLLLLILIWPALTSAQVFEHSGTPPQLIELYTSEGCSSCPPADDHLADLLKQPGLWEDRVPMAFHVDYWDYLGWEDSLAAHAFSQRQRAFKASGAFKAVYTPGWLVDGMEWRGYFKRADYPPAPTRQGGVLKADLQANGVLQVAYQPATDVKANYQVQAALLGFDISHRIQAGENRGSRLTHQFVVLEHHQQALTREASLELEKLDSAHRQALVVWVTKEGQYEPEQVAAGWVNLAGD